MEHEFWHERWTQGRTGFNQAAPHPMLVEHWSALGCPPDRAVFVPLAGKTIDMVWLADQGHRVIGNELSPIAVEQFFDERGLTPARRSVRSFEALDAEPYELWCGDLFELTAADLDGVGVVYDRASLVALPPEMRRRYADHLAAILPDASILLISFAYDQAEMNGPPFSVTADEITELFGHRYRIERVSDIEQFSDRVDRRERGLSAPHETVDVLRPLG
ncbi:MAG: thiopurine S-methyltransferase [Desertimonas sp.]